MVAFDRNRFYEILENPKLAIGVSLESLHETLAKYPAFDSAYLIESLNLKEKSTHDFESKLQYTAIQVRNRGVLHDLIYSTKVRNKNTASEVGKLKQEEKEAEILAKKETERIEAENLQLEKEVEAKKEQERKEAEKIAAQKLQEEKEIKDLEQEENIILDPTEPTLSQKIEEQIKTLKEQFAKKTIPTEEQETENKVAEEKIVANAHLEENKLQSVETPKIDNTSKPTDKSEALQQAEALRLIEEEKEEKAKARIIALKLKIEADLKLQAEEKARKLLLFETARAEAKAKAKKLLEEENAKKELQAKKEAEDAQAIKLLEESRQLKARLEAEKEAETIRLQKETLAIAEALAKQELEKNIIEKIEAEKEIKAVNLQREAIIQAENLAQKEAEEEKISLRESLLQEAQKAKALRASQKLEEKAPVLNTPTPPENIQEVEALENIKIANTKEDEEKEAKRQNAMQALNDELFSSKLVKTTNEDLDEKENRRIEAMKSLQNELFSEKENQKTEDIQPEKTKEIASLPKQDVLKNTVDTNELDEEKLLQTKKVLQDLIKRQEEKVEEEVVEKKKVEEETVEEGKLDFIEWLKLKSSKQDVPIDKEEVVHVKETIAAPEPTTPATEEVVLEEEEIFIPEIKDLTEVQKEDLIPFERVSAVEAEMHKEIKTSIDPLESFISSEIIRKRKRKKTEVNKSEKQENIVLVSETLAEILTLQQKYSEAIEVYEVLSIKYPQKSIYFANQIEKIKNYL